MHMDFLPDRFPVSAVTETLEVILDHPIPHPDGLGEHYVSVGVIRPAGGGDGLYEVDPDWEKKLRAWSERQEGAGKA